MHDCSIAGLGKLSPNLVLMGFKNNWRQDLAGLQEYVDVMYNAFDLKMSFAILRTGEGFDFSSQIASEQQIIREVPVAPGDKDEEEGHEDTLAIPDTDKVGHCHCCDFPALYSYFLSRQQQEVRGQGRFPQPCTEEPRVNPWTLR